MSVEVRRVTDAAEWNRCVERAPGASAFHRHEALSVQAAHSDSRVHPLVGYKGQEPVGLFPLFELRRGPITGVFSPPPYLWVPWLGPALLNVDKLKQRKRERRHEAFVTGCLDWLDEHLSAHYTRIRTERRYTDVRPYLWEGWDVTPGYTYVVDLGVGEDELLKRFSRGVRNDIKNTDEDAYTVEIGGPDAARRIIETVKRRYDAQGEPYEMTPAFAADLTERLPDEQIHPYELRIDGEFVTGVVVVESGDTAYRWQGGTKHDAPIPANDLLDWRVMCDAAERGRTAYDLIGAGDRRINQYKTKFNPELAPTYTLESGPARRLAEGYRQLRARVRWVGR